MQVHKIMWFILGTWMLDNLELLWMLAHSLYLLNSHLIVHQIR
jgi:hypothetical protein